MKAFVFPGQGAQFVGMGKDLYENNPLAKELFDKANDILGYRITDIMFDGTDEELKQTKVTQPAVFLQNTTCAKIIPVTIHLGQTIRAGTVCIEIIRLSVNLVYSDKSSFLRIKVIGFSFE